MRGQRTTSRLLAVVLLFSLLVSVPFAGTAAPARQDEQLQIAFSVPGLNFPFFVHMMNIARDKAAELDVELIELDGQDNSATQSAGIVVVVNAKLPPLLALATTMPSQVIGAAFSAWVPDTFTIPPASDALAPNAAWAGTAAASNITAAASTALGFINPDRMFVPP